MSVAVERDALLARVTVLESAIRKHRDQRGDDRCWLDDHTLYASLPEGFDVTALRLDEPCVMRANCERFIASRHDPSQPYNSPQREIDSLRLVLEAYKKHDCAPEIAALKAEVDAIRNTLQCPNDTALVPFVAKWAETVYAAADLARAQAAEIDRLRALSTDNPDTDGDADSHPAYWRGLHHALQGDDNYRRNTQRRLNAEDKVREQKQEITRLTQALAASERENARHRGCAQVEGDYVCGHEVAARDLANEVERLTTLCADKEQRLMSAARAVADVPSLCHCLTVCQCGLPAMTVDEPEALDALHAAHDDHAARRKAAAREDASELLADTASFRAFLEANAAEVATWPEWKRKAYELRREPETSGVVTTTEAQCTVCGSTPVKGRCTVCALGLVNSRRLVATNNPKILDGSPPCDPPPPAADIPPRAQSAGVGSWYLISDVRHPGHAKWAAEKR